MCQCMVCVHLDDTHLCIYKVMSLLLYTSTLLLHVYHLLTYRIVHMKNVFSCAIVAWFFIPMLSWLLASVLVSGVVFFSFHVRLNRVNKTPCLFFPICRCCRRRCICICRLMDFFLFILLHTTFVVR